MNLTTRLNHTTQSSSPAKHAGWMLRQKRAASLISNVRLLKMDNIVATTIGVLAFVIPALLMLYLRDVLYRRKNRKRDEQIKDIFSDNQELLIYRRGDGILALASIMFIVGGYVALSNKSIATGLAAMFVGIIGFMYFYSMTKYVKKQPYLVVNTNGLIHPFIGFIPWSDIIDMSYHTLSYRHQIHILKLTTNNIDQYLLKRPAWQRIANIVKPKFIEINIGKLTIRPEAIHNIAGSLLASYDKPNKALNTDSAKNAAPVS